MRKKVCFYYVLQRAKENGCFPLEKKFTRPIIVNQPQRRPPLDEFAA
jgi:hypothetical protein